MAFHHFKCSEEYYYFIYLTKSSKFGDNWNDLLSFKMATNMANIRTNQGLQDGMNLADEVLRKSVTVLV